MRESDYQKELIKKIKNIFDGCIVLKNDSSYIQGIPDLTIIFKNKYAMLEVKNSKSAIHQPNQDYYISKIDKDSFGRFIFPENEEEVLNELKQFFL